MNFDELPDDVNEWPMEAFNALQEAVGDYVDNSPKMKKTIKELERRFPKIFDNEPWLGNTAASTKSRETIINKDDVQNLVILLNTSSSFEDFLKSI